MLKAKGSAAPPVAVVFVRRHVASLSASGAFVNTYWLGLKLRRFIRSTLHFMCITSPPALPFAKGEPRFVRPFPTLYSNLVNEYRLSLCAFKDHETAKPPPSRVQVWIPLPVPGAGAGLHGWDALAVVAVVAVAGTTRFVKSAHELS